MRLNPSSSSFTRIQNTIIFFLKEKELMGHCYKETPRQFKSDVRTKNLKLCPHETVFKCMQTYSFTRYRYSSVFVLIHSGGSLGKLPFTRRWEHQTLKFVCVNALQTYSEQNGDSFIAARMESITQAVKTNNWGFIIPLILVKKFHYSIIPLPKKALLFIQNNSPFLID